MDLLNSFTRDGSSAAVFHSKCNGRSTTLTIIETADACVIGRYTNTAWRSTDSRQSANNAFLFILPGASLPGPIKLELKDWNEGLADWHHPLWGPGFGGGHDLGVYLDMIKMYSCLQCTYTSATHHSHSRGELVM